MRIALGAGLLVWVGATLLLSGWRRLTRPSLAARLRPYNPGRPVPVRNGGILSVESLRDVIGPLARAAGDRLAALFGINEALSIRLHRVHSDVDVTVFRVRQMAITAAALLAGGAAAAGVRMPAPAALIVVGGAPLLAFLAVEQRLVRASQRWQTNLARELPIVSEQVAMLLNAGYSVGAALTRVAQRGQGCAARDLARVVNRVRQGLSEAEALREWGDVAGVDAVDRFVAVLAAHSAASDLGRLVSAEARHGRRDLHRRTVEALERRGEQVWVPVTVATLVPGVILLAVPFLAALRIFSNA